MKDRPCFVQLECVDHEYENELMVLFVSLAFLSVFVSMFLDIPRFIGIAFLLILVLNTKWKYRTDKDGLYIEAKGFLDYKWKTSIKWTDVTDTSMVNPKTGKILFTLNNGKQRSVTLGRIKGRFSDIYNHRIEASIYQHLQKVGKAGNLQLRPDAESYFTEVPDWIPDTMSVEREEDDLIATRPHFLAIPSPYHMSIEKEEDGLITTYSVDPTLLEVKWIPNGEDPSYLDTVPKERIEFSRVQYCKWNAHTHNGFELEIFAGNANTRIKVDETETEMLKLVLAIIRQLRKNPVTDAVWMPGVLLDYMQNDRNKQAV